MALKVHRYVPGPTYWGMIKQRRQFLFTSPEQVRREYGDVSFDVDFAGRVLVAVHAGEKPTGGYWIRIESARLDSAGGLEIRFVEGQPGPDDMVTMVITHPMDFVLLERAQLTRGQVMVSFVGPAGVEAAFPAMI